MSFKLHKCRGLHERGVPCAKVRPGAGAVGGDQNGLNLRSATWSNDAENQLTSRTVPGYYEVVGQANPRAPVTVNSAAAYRRGEYFRKEFAAVPQNDDEAGVDHRALADGGLDAHVERAEDGARASREASESVNSVSKASNPPAGRVEGASDRSEIEAVRPETKPVATNCSSETYRSVTWKD